MSMDYTKPLLVPAGSDALGQIGTRVNGHTSVTTGHTHTPCLKISTHIPTDSFQIVCINVCHSIVYTLHLPILIYNRFLHTGVPSLSAGEIGKINARSVS